MESIIFRSVLLIVLINCIQYIHSAPTVTTLNPDKLSLLGEQGYEVVSKASKEYIAHMNNHLDILEDSDVSESSSNAEPDMLLYAKFYVLRKKDLHHSQLISHEKDLSGEINKRSLVVNSKKESNDHTSAESTTRTPGFMNNIPTAYRIRSAFLSQKEKIRIKHIIQDDDEDSIITFPNDSTTKAPQTYRYVHDMHSQGTKQNDDESTDNTKRPSKIFPRLAAASMSIRAADEKNLPNSTPLSHTLLKTEDEESELESFQHYSSDELVDWVVRNLKNHQIQKILRGEEISDSSIEDSKNDAKFEAKLEHLDSGNVSDRHFIQTPPRSSSCPEGQRKNHNGICVKPYVHKAKMNTLQTRLRRGNAQVKLAALFQSIVRAEMEVLKDLKAIEDLEITETITSTSSPSSADESSTTSSTST